MRFLNRLPGPLYWRLFDALAALEGYTMPLLAWRWWGWRAWWRVYVLRRSLPALTRADYQQRLAMRQARLRDFEALAAPACLIADARRLVDEAHADLEAQP